MASPKSSTSSESTGESSSNPKSTPGEPSTCHLCVFIHGLWGHPQHLDRVVGALRDAYPDELLQMLVTEKNMGNSTYDGIEVGGERVTQEIEDEIEKLKKSGKKVEKMSIAGYSMGGLVARYVIGLLFSKGIFEDIKPHNFTTFATPHLGVRTPLVGWHNELWNNLGGRTLSTTGGQLFTVDKFRDTDRPLLAVLADPKTIFMRGLQMFKRRSIYANIVNDRAVPYYTAMISKTDPFVDLDAIDIHYVEGYDNVILDSDNLATKKTQALTLYESMYNTGSGLVSRAPMYMLFGVLVPIGGVAYLVNSGIQTWRSAQRIRMHEEGKLFGSYRLPLMIEDVQRKTDAAFESLSTAQGEDYLPDSKSEAKTKTSSGDSGEEPLATKAEFPTLALTQEQFEMIDNLDRLGIDKYAVHIQKASHSHAAIVVRTQRDAFVEGKIVFRHWTERFEL